MKQTKYYLLSLILLACAGYAHSQGLKLSGFGGYNIQDRVHGYYGDVVIADGAFYGGMVSYEKSSQLSIDLTYMQQSTNFKISNYALPSGSGSIKGAVSYIMIGATHSPDFTGKVAPYAGAMLGAAVFAPKEKYADEWKFAVGMKLGATIHINEKFGIFLQTQLMVPVQGVGLGVGCGGGGCGTGVSTSSTATQLGFTGGIEVKLNN